MSNENQVQDDKANEQPWKWEILPEIMNEVFSEPVPETELEALQLICIKLAGLNREAKYTCEILREIQHDLRRITIEIC
jgi:hypothetical protein